MMELGLYFGLLIDRLIKKNLGPSSIMFEKKYFEQQLDHIITLFSFFTVGFEQKNITFGLFICECSKMCAFLKPVTRNFNFLQLSHKSARLCILTLPVILSFIKFCVAQTSITLFLIVDELKIPAIYKSIILFFSVNLPATSFLRKKI